MNQKKNYKLLLKFLNKMTYKFYLIISIKDIKKNIMT